MRIYVASSWRNEQQQSVVAQLRAEGHTVYDFKNPAPGNHGFGWKQCTDEPPPWSAVATRAVLESKTAVDAFAFDSGAMRWADAIVMLQPCGRSASWEAGWGAGAGKLTITLLADNQEPELMVKLGDHICVSIEEVIALLKPRRPSACVVITRNNKIAAIRSAKHGGALELPGGKALPIVDNSGRYESPSDNAIRECHEEIGIYPTLYDLLLRSPTGGYDCWCFFAGIERHVDLVSSPEGEAVWATPEEMLTGTYSEHTRLWLPTLQWRGRL
jgi:8-oxo-dGTP pyrophosphatase MutT (NUDIX family)